MQALKSILKRDSWPAILFSNRAGAIPNLAGSETCHKHLFYPLLKFYPLFIFFVCGSKHYIKCDQFSSTSLMVQLNRWIFIRSMEVVSYYQFMLLFMCLDYVSLPLIFYLYT